MLRSFGPCSIVSRACVKEIVTSDFSKQKPKSYHHNSCDSSQGHHQSLAQRPSQELLPGGHGLHRAGRLKHWHDWLLCWVLSPLGQGLHPRALLSSEPSFSFLFPELLGSGCPVCEETCRTIIELFLNLSLVLFPFCSTTVQLCIVFHNLCAR